MQALDLIVDEGRPANAGRFFQLGSDLLLLLDELSDVPISWRVEELRTGSAVARIAPPEDAPDDGRWLRSVVNSLASVQANASAVPDDWSPDAVRVAHRFVEHGQPSDDAEDWVAPRLVLVGGPSDRAVSLTPALGERLATLQPFERRMPGSVRGALVGLNVSRGNRASLKTASGKIVRVGFESALRGELREAMFQQVELHGEVRQDDNGRVFHVRAEGVTILARPDLRWSDLFGIAPNFTGGAPIDEFLEANRGEA